MHGGNIGVYSEGKGTGSTFYLQLPTYKLSSRNHKIDVGSAVDHHNDASSYTSRGNRSWNSLKSPKVGYSLQSNASGSSRKLLPTDNSVVSNMSNYSLRDNNISAENSVVDVSKSKVFSPTSKLHILIVDDSSTNRKMLSRLLSKDGHICCEVDDGKGAVEVVKESLNMNKEGNLSNAVQDFLETHDIDKIDRLNSGNIYNLDTFKVDIVLMDYFMKEVHGPEAAWQMRQLGFIGPIIGITGLIDDESDEFLRAGADVVLCKPVTVQAIWKALHSINATRKENDN